MFLCVQAFVHVSTAYSNADLSVVEERVYPPPRPLQQVYALVDTVPEELLSTITPQFVPFIAYDESIK